MHVLIDRVVESCLRQLAADPHILRWRAKEHDWVNYFALEYLLAKGSEEGLLTKPAQLAIEVAVPQPPGYLKPTVCRDIVIWSSPGQTCWDENWRPVQHPLAVVEWKVHRVGRRNRAVQAERVWLRQYCAWQPLTVGYAIEVDQLVDATTITCTRFRGAEEWADWLRLQTRVRPADGGT